MTRCIATFVAFAALFTTFARAAGDPVKAQPIVTQICAACHGVDGNSPLPANPSLAGQHEAYLLKQLIEFKSGKRNNPVMMGMVANLSEDDLRNLAAYYALRAPTPTGAKDKALVEQGRKLYRGGDAANATAACAGCHSPNGAGVPAMYPRLASQHADYVAAQLKAFRAGERANDPNQMMRVTASKLTDKDIAALAEYLSGLH